MVYNNRLSLILCFSIDFSIFYIRGEAKYKYNLSQLLGLVNHDRLPDLSSHCVFFIIRFDKRITQFAEEKFQRDGIDVKTNFKVVKVSGEAITMTNSSAGEVNVPYGMAVWSTGIGTRPIILDLMKQIDQVILFGLIIFISALFMVFPLLRSIYFMICYFLVCRVTGVS